MGSLDPPPRSFGTCTYSGPRAPLQWPCRVLRNASESDQTGARGVGVEVITEQRKWVDFRTLDLLRALCEPNEPDAALELVEIFLRESASQVHAILSASQQLDLATLERAAHRLKGGCAAIGATEMAKLATRIVDASRAESLDLALPHVQALPAVAVATRSALERYRNGGAT